MRSKAAGPTGDHLVANPEVTDFLADGNNAAGTLVANEDIAIGFDRIDAEQLHDVAEVEAGRMDFDFDLAGVGLAAADLIEGQVIHDSGERQVKAIAGVCRWRPFWRMQFEPCGRYAAGEASTITPCDFGLAIVCFELPEQVPRSDIRLPGIEVDETAGDAGIFRVDGASQTKQGRLTNGDLVQWKSALCAARDQP